MKTLEQKSDQSYQNLIALADRAADAAPHIPTEAMRRDPANLLTQPQAQLSAMATTGVET